MAAKGDGAQVAAERAGAHRLAELERLRSLIQAVIDYNQPLLRSPGQQATAQRRIGEAEKQLEDLDRELSSLRNEVA